MVVGGCVVAGGELRLHATRAADESPWTQEGPMASEDAVGRLDRGVNGDINRWDRGVAGPSCATSRAV